MQHVFFLASAKILKHCDKNRFDAASSQFLYTEAKESLELSLSCRSRLLEKVCTCAKLDRAMYIYIYLALQFVPLRSLLLSSEPCYATQP